MNTFFLDEESNTNLVSFETANDYGLMESILAADVTWSNIMIESMRNEYRSTLTEDADSVEANKQSWFKKVIEWFKKIGQKIVFFARNVVLNLSNKLGTLQKNALKWYANVEKNDDIKNGKIEVELYMEDPTKYIKNIKEAIDQNPENINNAMIDMDSTKSKKDISMNKKKVKVTLSMAEKAKNILVKSTFNEAISSLKSEVNKSTTHTNDGIKASQTGMKGKNDAEIKAAKDQVSRQQKMVVNSQKKCSAIVRLINMATLDCVKILKSGNKKAKED